MSNSLKSALPLHVPRHVCPVSLCHVLAPTPMSLSVPLLPVTFSWVPGSELLLMSHAFNLWIILFAFSLATSCWPNFKAKCLSLVSTRKHSHKAFMSTAKSQLRTNMMHPCSPTCRHALPCLLSTFYSLPNSLPFVPCFYSLLTYRSFHRFFSFLHACYIISMGSYLQSLTVYLGIFLNKIIPFLRGCLVQVIRIISFIHVIYIIVSEFFFFSLNLKYFDQVGKPPLCIFFSVFMTDTPHSDHPSVIISHGARY